MLCHQKMTSNYQRTKTSFPLAKVHLNIRISLKITKSLLLNAAIFTLALLHLFSDKIQIQIIQVNLLYQICQNVIKNDEVLNKKVLLLIVLFWLKVCNSENIAA